MYNRLYVSLKSITLFLLSFWIVEVYMQSHLWKHLVAEAGQIILLLEWCLLSVDALMGVFVKAFIPMPVPIFSWYYWRL